MALSDTQQQMLYNGGVQLSSTAIQAANSYAGRKWASNENQKNRDFQLEMYSRQMDDNIAWRDHQEQYNSPEAQMQRYRDAGINPMYAVTGSMQNTIQTPMQASGSGYGANSSPGSQSIAPLDAMAISNIKRNMAETDSYEALANKYNADALKAGAEAENIGYDNRAKQALEALEFNGKNYYQYQAETAKYAAEFARETQSMDFNEKKQLFKHRASLRVNELAKSKAEADYWNEQFKKAESEAEIVRVAKEWAKANQWINATTELIGALTGMVVAVKGTPLAPIHTVHNNTSQVFNTVPDVP